MPEYKSYQLVGGKPVIIDPLTVSKDGTVFAPEGHAFNPVVCMGSITTADNGKVVVDGELVEQTAMPEEITEDGEYDTTTYNSVTVSFGGGGGGGYDLEVAVDKAATLDDVAMNDYESGLIGVMSFAINLGGSPVNVEFGIRFGKNGGTPILTGGSWDVVGNQGAVAMFSYDPASPGMTCEKLLMISGTTVTDLTSMAANIISVITVEVYVPTT